MSGTSSSGTSRPAVGPHRVLVLSADMGAGHNATADSLEEAAQRAWPGSEIRRVDALDVMGRGVGPLFRGIYVGNVETTPWLYEFFYASLWRRRWFARASKRFTGSWCGRRLVREIERFDPDVIVSTYPLASSGLAWLRRHRGLSVPTAAWVSDFAPHTFWVYPDVDVTYVMDETALPVARSAEPEARVEVSVPPVASRFSPGDRRAAREELGLDPDRLVVLLSSGAYAFGDVARTVRALLDGGDTVQVVAACGRNTEIARALEALGLPRSSLVVLGWREDMSPLVRAADVVLTNAGGATALEALATGTPVVTSRPIAAHGEANANLMVVAGATALARDLHRLTALVRAAARDRSALEPLRGGGSREGAVDLEDALRDLAPPRRREVLADVERRTGGRGWRVRPADAFFSHAETGAVAQELGAVLEVGPTPGGRLRVADVAAAMQPRLPGLPPARRELLREGARGRRRPVWRLHDAVDAAAHVEERVVTSGDRTAWDEVGDFWTRRLPAGRPTWGVLVVRDETGGPDLVAVKMHHCHGDGVSALGLLDRFSDAAPGDPLRERRPAEGSLAARRAASAGLVVRGLAALAARGRAPRIPLTAVPTSPVRTVVGVPLPWSEVRRLAGRLGVRPHEVVVALAAEALDRLLRPAGLLRGRGERPVPLRAMVPVATRAPRLDRIAGNWTGALTCDLPTGPMPFEERARRVRATLETEAARGQAPAAGLVVELAGRLPAPLARRFARAVYRKRFFHTIVSYMPAARGSRWFAGAPVRAVHPVLPLAPGVPVTVGAVVADGVLGVGVLLDTDLGLTRRAVEDAVRGAFTAAGGALADVGGNGPADGGADGVARPGAAGRGS